MGTKKEPTTAAELTELTVTQLEKLAKKRSITVLRGDGDEGDPLHADYVKALAVDATGRRTVVPHKYVDAQGNPVNDEGERVNKYGDVLEDE